MSPLYYLFLLDITLLSLRDRQTQKQVILRRQLVTATVVSGKRVCSCEFDSLKTLK